MANPALRVFGRSVMTIRRVQPRAAATAAMALASCAVLSTSPGRISMAAGVELKVPHGGIFVLPIPGAVSHVGAYVVALVAGTLVSAVLVGLLKRPLATA